VRKFQAVFSLEGGSVDDANLSIFATSVKLSAVPHDGANEALMNF